MKKLTLIMVGMLVCLFIIALKVEADPIVSLRNGAQFQNALTKKCLRGIGVVRKDSIPLNRAFPGQNSQIRTTSLSVPPTFGPGFLLSEAGAQKDLQKQILGGYLFDYTVCPGFDPDLSNVDWNVNVLLPKIGSAGISSLAFAVMDENNLVKFWRYDLSALNQGAESFNIHFGQGAGVSGETSFGQEPGFDVTHSLFLHIGFEGTLSSSYPLSATGKKTLWVATNELFTAFSHNNTVPEPSGVAVLLCGILGGLGMFRRSSARRQGARC